jgi:hypothetical protein
LHLRTGVAYGTGTALKEERMVEAESKNIRLLAHNDLIGRGDEGVN